MAAPKMRIMLRFFVKGLDVENAWVIEALVEGKWRIFKDDDDNYKYPSREKATERLITIKAKFR